MRTEERQSARIDHRPLGAESYNRTVSSAVQCMSWAIASLIICFQMAAADKDAAATSSVLLTPPIPAARTSQQQSGFDSSSPKITKFEQVQRKWVNNPGVSSRESKLILPSGSTPVKSLTGQFESKNDRSLLEEQKKEIETLRAQVAIKEQRIRELEEQIRRIGNGHQEG